MTTLQQILEVIPSPTQIEIENANYDVIFKGYCSDFRCDASWPGAIHIQDFLNSEVDIVNSEVKRTQRYEYAVFRIKLRPYCYIVTTRYESGLHDTTVLKNFNFEELEAEWHSLQNAIANNPAIKNYSIEIGGFKNV